MSSPVSPINHTVSLSPLNPAFKAASPTKVSIPTKPPVPQRTPSFPPSRPIRPFASIKPALTRPKVKIIQPPAGFCGQQFFVLNMTQGELARRA